MPLHPVQTATGADTHPSIFLCKVFILLWLGLDLELGRLVKH